MRKTKIVFFIFLFHVACLFFSFKYVLKDKPYVFPKIIYFPPMPVSAENPVTINGVELGRYLFYDPILSADSSVSCASCHKQQYAFSDSPNRLSKGMSGQLQSRNTLPLFNLAWYQKLFWDGRAATIEAQVFHPVRDLKEMNLNWNDVSKKIQKSKFYSKKFKALYGAKTIDSTLISNVIAQFERTLISYNAKYDKVVNHKAKFTLDELEGMELMNDMTKGNCLHCHTTDGNGLGTTGDYSNNGLDELTDKNKFKDPGLGFITKTANDNGKFKVPSLRNLLFTAPYMHDGRFNTLEEVLDFYSEGLKISPTIDSKMEFAHKGGSKLTKYEKKKIILFLKTLSDSAFISAKEFSDPFHK
ncbi:MAG: cytochrome-c peroxidase [Bacteroidetes bacterium]|nr:cytochrome-c peroxidase [Bacteroidota bacterium]